MLYTDAQSAAPSPPAAAAAARRRGRSPAGARAVRLPLAALQGLLTASLLLGGCDSVSGTSSERDQLCDVRLALEAGRYEGGLALAEQQAALKASEPVVHRFGPERMFPGGHVFVLGQALGGAALEPPRLRLVGQVVVAGGGATPVEAELAGHLSQGGQRAEFPLEAAELHAWGLPQGSHGSFSGVATLLTAEAEAARTVAPPTFSLDFEILPALDPKLRSLSIAAANPERLDAYPEDELQLDATDLLLGGEGSVELILTVRDERAGADGAKRDYALPVHATLARTEGSVRLAAEILGIRPGSLVGEARLRQQVQGGPLWESAALPLELRLQPPLLAGIDPPAASRGAWVTLVGRGFLPNTETGATLLRLDGRFVPDSGDAPLPLDGEILSPDEYLDSSSLRYALRSEVRTVGGERTLVGLSAQPGRFEGRITPIIAWDRDEVEGLPYTEGFRVGPTLQVVYIKFLPGFTVSLRQTWGMKNVERELRERVFEVLRRDYTGIHIEFTDQRPRDTHEYVVMEVGGLDPNGRDLFGLDNTTGEEGDSAKDVGNLRLQEIIGGRNARAEEQGYLAYGGVFLESFRQFSTQLSQPIGLASPRFDEIFSGVAPFLCGEEVAADEYPGGPRDAEIEQAIAVLGNLVGNTISHEIGHSLGLSLPRGDPFSFHNLFDTPNTMMDAGQDRPFEERAEIDGAGPAHFNSENLDYLHSVLPLP